MNLNENVRRIKEVMGLITESEGSYDAVLVGGLDYRSSDFPIDQQVELLKKGFGSDKNIKGFRYNASTSDVLNFMSQNPGIPVFLFSAGCTKASDLSKSPNVDKEKLYIIEPYAVSETTKSIVRLAVANGVPSSNVYVGGSQGRGQGIVDGSSSSNSSSHFGALTSVGSMKSGTGPTNIEKTQQPDLIDSEELDVKEFQTWLDKNHPGWHNKYGTLNDNMGKGWGVFGPNTKKAWNNPEMKKGYLDSKS
jgi:hypothetical protein